MSFFGKKEKVHAVDGVTFQIEEGNTFGLVGESGCGKSTVGRLLLALLEPSGGTVNCFGKDLFNITPKELFQLRAQMQIIFQDPFASLNPRKTVRQILSKPFSIHTKMSRKEQEKAILNLLDLVGLSPPEFYISRHPHEFSGGQRQRIGIARALAVNPKFVVADEAVSALDISVQAQILKLFKKLQEELHLTCLFITHDLAVVRSVCSQVGVMYLGRLVEIAAVDELFEKQCHPYTRALCSATPLPNPSATRSRKQIILEGDIPSPIHPPTGCRFHTRCPKRFDPCDQKEPELMTLEGDHQVACHLRLI
ncbi:MAG: ATP-binding cassette domain-containing protein [Deltaproteobacteria bacterium]|nr:ATP-binding cassette domain-containing protein [Deltaproteobacteria bacterium]MBW2154265.1 ATP-binding cassette domain-containing protein [Deltaproteobacteria bacterium]